MQQNMQLKGYCAGKFEAYAADNMQIRGLVCWLYTNSRVCLPTEYRLEGYSNDNMLMRVSFRWQ